jgi:hypothetical protein
MVIRGESNIIKVYDLTPVIDLDSYDFGDAKDLERFSENVVSYLDAGEVEAIEMPTDLMGVVPDSAEIEINENVYSFEDVTYKNRSVDEIITQQFNEGDVILLLQANGDGYFEYEVNPDINDVQIGYTACDIDLPDEPIYDFFCDLMLPDDLYVNGEKAEIAASNFYPKDTMVAEVYRVTNGHLERIAEIDVMHFGWDLFEDLIQVDYDENQ